MQTTQWTIHNSKQIHVVGAKRTVRQARENACEQVTIGFGGFTSGARIFSQLKAYQGKTKAIAEITFDTHLKTALSIGQNKTPSLSQPIIT